MKYSYQQNVMKTAWEIRRAEATIQGKNVLEINFSRCLIQAHDAHKRAEKVTVATWEPALNFTDFDTEVKMILETLLPGFKSYQPEKEEELAEQKQATTPELLADVINGETETNHCPECGETGSWAFNEGNHNGLCNDCACYN